MRPLREAELGDVVGVAFDVDDTLTTRGALTTSAYASLWALRDAGISLIAATGRPLGWADAMASTWPIDAAVGENGAGWSWRERGALRVAYADDEQTRRGQRATLDDIRRAVAEHLPDVREAGDNASRRCDLTFDVGERASLPETRVDALVALIREHGARATVSSVHAHAMPGDWDKARGIAGAATRALGGFDRQRWIFVGDSGNDAEAFACFERSVGVANVRAHLDRLSTPPRWITDADRGEGFSELARAILEARSDD